MNIGKILGYAIADWQSMKLKNYQEDLVLYVADIVMKDRPDIEADENLLHDVAAYTLNRLPPRYILSERGFTRLAADHWVDSDNEDGLASLVEVLILVNKAIDIVKSRRKIESSTWGAAQSPEEEIPDVRKFWHNLPYLIGRVLDKESRKPVLDACVRVTIDGRLAEPAERGWLNPYCTNAGTKGFYSFLPKPIRSRSKNRIFTLGLRIEHRDYEPVSLERKFDTVGELTTYQYIRSDQILNLSDTYLVPAGS
ncbi:MAG: late competence development ComFB family protein [Spirochaetaceae bacterium]|nr:MAG: late competence development ComFB family protein [Spirochaetaceae bacterium]